MFNYNYNYFWFFFFFFFSLFFFMLYLFFVFTDYVLMLEYKILYVNSMGYYYLILLDWVSLSFCSVVMFISSMVILYSYNYVGSMSYSSNRFLFIVVLFIFSMMLMVLSPNMVSIMLGWDGLGLVSYCLVIYYSSMNSYLAGLITCLTNRLGDVGLLISVGWIMSYGSWHFVYYSDLYFDTIFYLVVFSCFTKSAQVPFSCWLPAAMAAPTPVSSLVHSSTLVTAGVYLLIRFCNFFVFNYFFLFLSIFTMIFSSLCAMYEFDLKKIIALSTLSQLGLMMSSLFVGLIDLSFFHLLTHAMFKSLLFLCSGIFIYYMNDNQDIRMMGSVCMFLPLTSSCFNIANFALCGVPFLSGFYSKDFFVENMSFIGMNFVVFFLFYISLGMTACYSFRLFYYTMVFNSKFLCYNFFCTKINLMKVSIFFLTFFAVFFGCMFMWIMSFDLVFVLLPFNLKVFSLLFVLLGFWLGIEFCKFNYFFSFNFYLFNSYMWFMFGYSYFVKKFFLKSSFFLTNHLLGWGEYYGGLGISFYLVKISSFFQLYSMSSISLFLISFFIWFFIMI
uniref:NADH-ubiquinone oxidoreductase chain 5 n=1 Tax=Bothrogonia yunana TaxID=1079933 RepID=A0A7D5UFN9_9HEMI|nr:NADH dehydrogenase subunit 5 [Bothrogonia yunana]QLI54106.1 NADH dehydrogenase subunit 5 [Bothrogonia yunana]